MTIIIAFLLLFIISFGALIFLTRPTRTENIVRSRLDMIGRLPKEGKVEVVDILKKESLSDLGWFDAILKRFGPAVQLRRLLNEADQDWTVGQLVLGAL